MPFPARRVSAGLRPDSAYPLGDDLFRPWRGWWGLSISRYWWLLRSGDRCYSRIRARSAPRWGSAWMRRQVSAH